MKSSFFTRPLVTPLIVAFVVTVMFGSTAQAQGDGAVNPAISLLGTEFVVAFPINDGSQFQGPANLEIYITSPLASATVDVRVGSSSAVQRLTISRGESVTLATNKTGVASLPAAIEILPDDSEKVMEKGITITSTAPIAIHVMNAKAVSSDGYTAIPTHHWDTLYLATTYYDFNEKNNRNTWAGGFCVVAKDDDTEVTMRLRGTGGGLATTRGGRRIGDEFTVTLQRGEVYQVMGDGTTRNMFDLTGSVITSTKPVGLISFHARTAMPNAGPMEGRDHLAEMTPPVSAWGKRYVTLEYSRERLNGLGRGDYYRVLAAYDSTLVTGRFYDKMTKNLIGNINSGRLNAGEFQDFYYPGATPGTFPYGVVMFESNKPFFVMQYSTSASWDGDTQNDPFMINVTPIEQFLSGAVFQTPTLDNYNVHLLNLVIHVLHPETEIEDLQSLQIDGKPLWNSTLDVESPALLAAENPIPYDTRYRLRHVTIRLIENGGSHTITTNGRLRFGGYVYGFGNFDSYGYPAAAGFPDLSADAVGSSIISTIDTVNPSGSQRTIQFATVNAANGGSPRIAYVREDLSFNVSLQGALGHFSRVTASTRAEVTVEQVDTTSPAFARLIAYDFAGNVDTITVSFAARDTTTSSVDASELSALRVYPVPATSWIHIEGLSDGGQLQLFDSRGVALRAERVETATMELDLTNVPTGLYILVFTNNGRRQAISVPLVR